jgi:hypothetical protein
MIDEGAKCDSSAVLVLERSLAPFQVLAREFSAEIARRVCVLGLKC